MRPEPDIKSFLAAAGYAGPFTVTRLEGGANNQIYRIDREGDPLLLKAYFRHEGDPRDRLHSEFTFCSFAWERGLRCLPQPLASDEKSGFGLYEFIQGRPLSASEITRERMAEASAFFVELNRHKTHPAASSLPTASEACFSVQEHLECVEKRVNRLAHMGTTSKVERDALRLVKDELIPAWVSVRENAVEQSRKQGVVLEETAPPGDRCISPSDFGFHNAILTPAGALRFIDFEYAGWDDPAKTICDFFCQPQVAVPPSLLDPFAEAVASCTSVPSQTLRRARMLLPVYRIKWCCIMLNEFQAVDGRRRAFAGPAGDLEERRSRQLQKARTALSVVLQEGVTNALR